MSVELLAPAGSYEGVIQNLEYGADAIYVGGNAFGARAYAKNLNEEELLDAIDQAHIRGKRMYLTVNTLLKNRELYASLYAYLRPLYEQGLDAVIVQDYGVMDYIRKEFPGMHIHASTQMTVTGPEGARLLENCGVSRVVTARELSLEEIARIRESCDLEIESFVHGALCYCYSGQCLFSSILGGRSGNRGRCAQPCRLPYTVKAGRKVLTAGGEVCPLSPKDMCTIDILPDIIQAGVTSLKIEGRMKQTSYAAGVVNIYRKYLDLYLDHPDAYHVEEADRRELLALFNRGGFSRGYYQMRKGPAMMAFSNEKKVGDSHRDLIKMKEKVKGNLMVSAGEPVILELEYAEHRIQVQGDVVQTAVKQPLEEERIRRQMMKTGNVPYEFEQLQIELHGAVFMPMSVLNSLRREGFERLEEQLRDSFRRDCPERLLPEIQAHNQPVGNPRILASCETIEQAEELLKIKKISGIYCPVAMAVEILKSAEVSPNRLQGKEIHILLPHMIRYGDMEKLQDMILQATKLGADRILCRTLESAAWLLHHGMGRRVILDSSIYTFNNSSIHWWREQGICSDTAPLELNRQELAHRNNRNSEMAVYGYLPMMLSAQCLQDNLNQCRKNYGILTLTDRYHKNFSAKCYCDFCYNVIYNSLPYGLLKEAKQVKELGFPCVRLSFTLESPDQVRKIAEAYIKCYNGEDEGTSLPIELTKGHFKRGVE